MTQTTHRVIRLGQFAGGSFGVAGHPANVYEYFAVESDVIAADRDHTVTALVGKAFRTRQAAEQRLDEIVQAERDAAQRAEIERQRQRDQRQAGADVRATLMEYLGRDPGRIRFSDRLIPDDRLTAGTVDAVRGLTSGAYRDYDAQIEDGSLYRVRVGCCLGSRRVAPLTTEDRPV